jgi:hypothetical protein
LSQRVAGRWKWLALLGEQREDARDVGRLRLLRGRPARGVDARWCMGRAVVADEPELADCAS